MPFNRLILLRSTPYLRSAQLLLSLPLLLLGIRTTDKNARLSVKNARLSLLDRLPLLFATILIIKQSQSCFQGSSHRNSAFSTLHCLYIEFKAKIVRPGRCRHLNCQIRLARLIHHGLRRAMECLDHSGGLGNNSWRNH